MTLPRAALAAAALAALACDPVSRLHGSVRTPESAVAGAQVQMVCPWGVFRKERRVVGEPSPAVSDANGEFTIHLASFDSIPDRCMLRVKMPEGTTFETVISTLGPETDVERRIVRVKIVPPDVTRLPSAPPPPASP